MPGNQPNVGWSDYLDDQAAHWSVRGEVGGPAAAIDGHATVGTAPAFGRMTKRRHVRYAEWTDATTFRKTRTIIYTPTAFAAISVGDTVSVPLQGVATSATYTLSALIPEKQPVPGPSRHLADT